MSERTTKAPDSTPRKGTKRKWARRAVLFAVLLVITAPIAGWLVGPSIAAWYVEGPLARALSDKIGGELTLSGADLSWTGGVALDHAVLAAPNGTVVADVSVSADAGMLDLVMGRLDLGVVHLGGFIDLSTSPDGEGAPILRAALPPRMPSETPDLSPRPTDAPSASASPIPSGLRAILRLEGLRLIEDGSEHALTGELALGDGGALTGEILAAEAAGELALTVDLRGVGEAIASGDPARIVGGASLVGPIPSSIAGLAFASAPPALMPMSQGVRIDGALKVADGRITVDDAKSAKPILTATLPGLALAEFSPTLEGLAMNTVATPITMTLEALDIPVVLAPKTADWRGSKVHAVGKAPGIAYTSAEGDGSLRNASFQIRSDDLAKGIKADLSLIGAHEGGPMALAAEIRAQDTHDDKGIFLGTTQARLTATVIGENLPSALADAVMPAGAQRVRVVELFGDRVGVQFSGSARGDLRGATDTGLIEALEASPNGGLSPNATVQIGSPRLTVTAPIELVGDRIRTTGAGITLETKSPVEVLSALPSEWLSGLTVARTEPNGRAQLVVNASGLEIPLRPGKSIGFAEATTAVRVVAEGLTLSGERLGSQRVSIDRAVLNFNALRAQTVETSEPPQDFVLSVEGSTADGPMTLEGGLAIQGLEGRLRSAIRGEGLDLSGIEPTGRLSVRGVPTRLVEGFMEDGANQALALIGPSLSGDLLIDSEDGVRVSARLDTPTSDANLRLLLTEAGLTVEPWESAGAQVRLRSLSEEASKVILEPLFPLFAQFNKDPRTDSPMVISTQRLSYTPEAGLNGELQISLGSMTFAASDLLGEVLSATSNRRSGRLGGNIAPMVVSIQNSVARYEDFVVPWGEVTLRSRGTVDLRTGGSEIVLFVPISELSGDVRKLTRQIPGLAPAAVVPMRITRSGAGGAGGGDGVVVELAADLLEEVLPGVLEGLLERGLRDLFGG